MYIFMEIIEEPAISIIFHPVLNKQPQWHELIIY